MEFTIIKPQWIQFVHSKKIQSFYDVLDLLSAPLEKENYISTYYKYAIAKNLEKNGPYFIIAPEIALPHAQAHQDVFQTGITILRLNQAISIQNQAVKLFIFLASKNNEEHLHFLSKLAHHLDTLEKQKKLLTCSEHDFKVNILSLFTPVKINA